MEIAVRAAVHAVGAELLEELLETVGVGRRDSPVQCKCGARMDSRGQKEKTIKTLLGDVRFCRSVYRCPACGKKCCPGDQELDVVGTGYSPGVRRVVSDFGNDLTFKKSSRHIATASQLIISPKDCERITEGIGEDMECKDHVEREKIRFLEPPPPEAPKDIETLYIEFDGTGVPMVKSETQGRKGKQKDGSAKTREAKLGCVFTQTSFDEKGRPVRDPASTTYTGAIETAAVFKQRIYAEAVRRGLYQAKRIIVLSDGAKWIRAIVEEIFPNAIHIIDLYHVREHLCALCREIFERDIRRLNFYQDRWWDELDEGNIEKIIAEAGEWLPKDKSSKKEARQQIGYFERNKERMRYAQFKADGLFLGSGVVESACKTIVGERLKKSGMEWSLRGANAVIALRCATASNRDEEYWEQRAG